MATLLSSVDVLDFILQFREDVIQNQFLLNLVSKMDFSPAVNYETLLKCSEI